MKRLHIFVPLERAAAVEAALSTLLSEPWTGALRRGDTTALDGSPLASPYPGAAWCSGQWEDAVADRITAEVQRVAPAAAIGQGCTLGAEASSDELAPHQVPTMAQAQRPRESLARVYSRGSPAFTVVAPVIAPVVAPVVGALGL